MALVICMVEETEAIRFRISFRLAIYSNALEVSWHTVLRVSSTLSVNLPAFNSAKSFLCFFLSVAKNAVSNSLTLSTGTFLKRFFDPA